MSFLKRQKIFFSLKTRTTIHIMGENICKSYDKGLVSEDTKNSYNSKFLKWTKRSE